MPDYDRSLQDLKEDIKSRTDIVELISGYTSLKRAGKNWTGLCPFHTERNPSFRVTPELGFYKCWSCGESGDALKFVQKKENLEFVEALRFLAKRAGIPFEWKAADKEKASEKQQMFALNALALQFFQDRLSKSPEAREYLTKRGILRETQDQFQLGYAPPDWEALTFFLQRKQVDTTLALKVGLIKARENEGSGHYDFYRNRLMFPIHDVHGDIVGFGGRTLGEDRAKYLNSSESAAFAKSKTLYGLYFARKKLLSGDTSPVFVEGYIDVITAHQAGFTQCIATLGTAMTEEHAALLRRFNKRVILCYDSDAAGIKANLRGAAVWETVGGEGAEVRVARLPAGDDPDSLLLRDGGTSVFQRALDEAIPRVDFEIELIRQRHDLRTDQGRVEALTEIVPLLATVRSTTLRSRYIMNSVDLHPLHERVELTRVMAQIEADVQQYAAQHKNEASPRERGYPLTEQTNRAPLAEQPASPNYRPPNKQQWGAWPMTQQVVRKGEGGEKREWKDYKDRRRQKGPIGDSTPPSLEAPLLTGVEKAERQLLRACFSPEWRAFILARLHPDYLVTILGRRLFDWIARTPATEEGGIDPRVLLRLAEEEENEGDPYAEEDSSPLIEEQFDVTGASTAAPLELQQNIAKMSYFIREVLEDSPFLVSNESLNESSVNACILRLQKHRKDQVQRELAEMLRRAEEMLPEQRRAFIEQYHQKVRETRGSPVIDGQ